MHILFAALLAIAHDPRALLVGTWKGESICTSVRPACHDEIAVYHISIPSKPGVIDMAMNKMIRGKEAEMGGQLEYKVNADATKLSADIDFNGNHIRFSFTRTGDKMVGTLIDIPTGAVIRNIRLAKE
ncbi:MAG TPA: hypothetical protein VL284_17320 [Thermoanaerobaculia bacterium]|nr:hypothetical protein [Thermoanaerobaculia bacterium]